MSSNSNCQWVDVQDNVSLPDTEVKTVAMESTPVLQVANSYLPKVGQIFDVFIKERFLCVVAIFCQMDDGRYILLSNEWKSEPFTNWSEVEDKIVTREKHMVSPSWLSYSNTNLHKSMVLNNCTKMLARIATEHQAAMLELEAQEIVNLIFLEFMRKGPIFKLSHSLAFMNKPASGSDPSYTLLAQKVLEKFAIKPILSLSRAYGNDSKLDISVDFSPQKQ